MPFAAATVLTNKERAMVADRLRTTPATYTTAPKFLAIGTGATGAARTAAAADTALTTEVETRTSGTESILTTSITGDTLQVSGLITMTAPRAIDEIGLFDAASTGNMAVSITQAVDNFNTGDTFTITIKIQWL